jgi:asparagine synthase (glutamine-hydrolysing)
MHLPEIHRASDKIYVEKYLDILKTAVSDRTRTDGVIGSALSGGLDSTSVAALSKAPHTFSIEYPEAPGSDESFFIQKAIEFIKPAYPHILKGHEECQIWQLDQFFQYEDEPFITITHGPTRGLYRRAAAEGVEVLLEGFAGDEVSSHSAQALGEAIRLGRWADARALLRLIKNYKSGALKKLKYIWKTGAEDLLRHAGIRIRREAERSLPYLRRLNSIASDELLQHLNLPGKYSQIRPRGIKDHTYIHSIYLFYPYLEAIERSAAYHGVDARFPYLDKRLIEYCVSLPFSQTLGKNIFGRYQLRRAMEGHEQGNM